MSMVLSSRSLIGWCVGVGVAFYRFGMNMFEPFALSSACPEPVEGSKGFDKLSLNGF